MSGLDGVRVGDLIAILNRYGILITTAMRVTPKGKVTTAEGTAFWPNGAPVGGDLVVPRWARKATPDDLEKVRQDFVRGRLQKMNWRNVSIAACDAVLAIVDAAQGMEAGTGETSAAQARPRSGDSPTPQGDAPTPTLSGIERETKAP